MTVAPAAPAPPAQVEYFSWQLRGSCLDFPVELFFPEEEVRKRVRRQREEQAKRICQGCPVLANCREHALSTPEKYGIWGATTARERALRASMIRARDAG
ncbi:MAG: WhiB family transcriptional regulator [Mycobacterium sp.]|nr:WhiB family transcriptional regulator [Mycobacterium sp.]